MRERFVGLMSGTSQDGIDAVLATFEDGRFLRVEARRSGAYSPTLRAELVELAREATPVSLLRYATLDRFVADAFADTALDLLGSSGVAAAEIAAIGSHGQTVFHDPKGARSSLQLGDPSRIAIRTGITVVGDFRRADVALGGQGAPLLPAFHHAVFADAAEPRAVLNLGGIANLTLLPDARAESVRGFDTGPASCLMDEWAERHLNVRFDDGGAFAASGTLDAPLLAACLAEPYLGMSPPKSTGRGLFNLDWLERRSQGRLSSLAPADVQRTLCEFTAHTIATALTREAPSTRRLLVSGGGVNNAFLLSRLAALLPGVAVQSTADHGLDPQGVEGAGFAWFACRRLRNEPANLPGVTGASRLARLGGIFAP
ncbi:MAG TPA: anhydro-N-acetylmuramic acid kinase [Nevskiaceae bacterium]|nr:anhydro-N-acetylmuramic acid kinase [Nevskiaceae bacterium]